MKQEEEACIVRIVTAGRLIDGTRLLPASHPLLQLASDERLRFNSEPSSPDVPDPPEQVTGDGDIDDTSVVPVFSLRAEQTDQNERRQR